MLKLIFLGKKTIKMSALREKILHVASDLFHSRGINSTGVDTIVAVAGTTKMTLYKYFRSKEDLILEVLQKGHEDFQAWLNESLSLSSKQPVTSPDFRGMAFIKASAEFPNEESPVHKLSAEHAKEFRIYIAGLAKEAGISDSDGLALQLSMLIEGAMQAEQMKRGSGAIKYAKKAAKILIDSAPKKH